MVTILFGMLGFTVVILALVVILLAVKAKLSPGGKVTIGINGDPEKALEVNAGSTLLATLAGNGIFIPSACGGKGTCGVCTCDVRSGGGALLPTEVSHISPKEARSGRRLACLTTDVAPLISSARTPLRRLLQRFPRAAMPR